MYERARIVIIFSQRIGRESLLYKVFSDPFFATSQRDTHIHIAAYHNLIAEKQG